MDAQVSLAAQLCDGLLCEIGRQRLAVPAVLVLDLLESLALDGARDDDARPVAARPCGLERLVDLDQVVPVDDDRPASERLDAVAVDVEIPFVFGWSALAEPVDVEDRGEIREPVVTPLVERLPD